MMILVLALSASLYGAHALAIDEVMADQAGELIHSVAMQDDLRTPAIQDQTKPDEVQILGLLQTQQDAWNNGDIEGFMEGYWKSEALRFTSGGSIERGWAETLARYQRNYPDRSAMGRLEFSELDVDLLSADAATVFGRFTLYREADEPTGLFTLILRKHDGAWRIVSDHTSTD